MFIISSTSWFIFCSVQVISSFFLKKNHFSATCSFCLSPVHAGFSLHVTEKQLHRNTFTFLCLTLGSACHRTAKIVNRLTNLISSFITVTHPAVSLTSPPYSCVVIMHTGCLYCRHQGCCSCSRPNRTRFIPSYLPFILAAVWYVLVTSFRSSCKQVRTRWGCVDGSVLTEWYF